MKYRTVIGRTKYTIFSATNNLQIALYDYPLSQSNLQIHLRVKIRYKVSSLILS